MRKPLDPKRRVHSRQPMVKCNQLRILPTRLHQMHQPPHLLEAKQKKQMRIPESPEMPESLRQSGTDIPFCLSFDCKTPLLALRGPRLNPTQDQNRRANRGLSEDQTKWVPQILCKQSHQCCRQCQITQRDKLKHSAS